MENEETQKTTTEDKPISLVDEARKIRDEIVKEKEALKAERESLERVKSEQILSGTTGNDTKQEIQKEETPKEHRQRIERELREGKYNTKW